MGSGAVFALRVFRIARGETLSCRLPPQFLAASRVHHLLSQSASSIGAIITGASLSQARLVQAFLVKVCIAHARLVHLSHFADPRSPGGENERNSLTSYFSLER